MLISASHTELLARLDYLLLAIKAAVDEARGNSETHLELEQLTSFVSRYNSTIALGHEENSFFEVREPESKN